MAPPYRHARLQLYHNLFTMHCARGNGTKAYEQDMNTYRPFDTISDTTQSINPRSSFAGRPAFDAWVHKKQIELKNQTWWEKKAGGRLGMEVARRLVFSAARRETRGHVAGSIVPRFAGV